MKITVLTCTSDRPEAFALSEKYMARQTLKPDQWIVLDDGLTPVKPTMGQEYYFLPDLHGTVSMVAKVKYALSAGLIRHEALAFWEDDDFYDREWLEWCVRQLQNYDLVGEGRAIYFNVAHRCISEHGNMAHASLCSTAMRTAFLGVLGQVCAGLELGNQYIDTPLWAAFPPDRRRVFDPNVEGRRLTLGMKAMPGRIGCGGGHVGKDPSAKDDNNLYELRKMIGDDAANYAPFSMGGYAAAMTAPGLPTWLANLRGKPNIVGVEIGALRGGAAEWMISNIFTGTNAHYFCLENQKDCEVEAAKRDRLSQMRNVTIIEGKAHETMATATIGALDVALVNADNDEGNLVRYAGAAFEKLKVGGKMILSGYGNVTPSGSGPSPKQAIDHFLGRFDGRYFMFARGPQVVLLKQ
jgi:hypothetical protein